MAVTIERLERLFVFNGVKLPDPNPDFTVEQVRDMYVNTYPELATAAVEGPSFPSMARWNTNSCAR